MPETPPGLLRELAEATKAGATDAEMRAMADAFWADVLGLAVADGVAKAKEGKADA